MMVAGIWRIRYIITRFESLRVDYKWLVLHLVIVLLYIVPHLVSDPIELALVVQDSQSVANCPLRHT